eukprot:3153266-Alexandrium_andersonii.AAC.1
MRGFTPTRFLTSACARACARACELALVRASVHSCVCVRMCSSACVDSCACMAEHRNLITTLPVAVRGHGAGVVPESSPNRTPE